MGAKSIVEPAMHSLNPPSYAIGHFGGAEIHFEVSKQYLEGPKLLLHDLMHFSASERLLRDPSGPKTLLSSPNGHLVSPNRYSSETKRHSRGLQVVLAIQKTFEGSKSILSIKNTI